MNTGNRCDGRPRSTAGDAMVDGSFRGGSDSGRSVLVDRRPWAGIAEAAGAGWKTACHLGAVGLAGADRPGASALS